MGLINTKPQESEEVIQAREYRSELMQEQRKRRHKAFTAMVQRVISSDPTSTFIDLLPPEAFFHILEFLTPDIPTLLSVCPKWHVKIMETLDNTFAPIESQFAMIHSNLFCFKRSFTDFTKIFVSDKKGIRIDRVIVAEVLPCLIGKTIKVRYNYRQSALKYYQKAEFKFDCTRSGKRTVWAYRDEFKFHGEDGKKAFTQMISTINENTSVEIAVNWFNLSGNINLNSIQWQSPIIKDTKTILKNLQLAPKFSRDPQDDSDGINKKLYLYNVYRHCELELSQTEWYDAKYYLKQNQVYSYDYFYPFLRMTGSEFAGVDVTVSRNTYKAEKVGIVPDSLARIGVLIEIKAKGEEVTQEVKKYGLVYDRHRPIELALGDSFVLYISRGG